MTFMSLLKNSWAAFSVDFNNPMVLTLLIRFHIYVKKENNNLTETDPKSQRNNIFFVKL